MCQAKGPETRGARSRTGAPSRARTTSRFSFESRSRTHSPSGDHWASEKAKPGGPETRAISRGEPSTGAIPRVASPYERCTRSRAPPGPTLRSSGQGRAKSSWLTWTRSITRPVPGSRTRAREPGGPYAWTTIPPSRVQPTGPPSQLGPLSPCLAQRSLRGSPPPAGTTYRHGRIPQRRNAIWPGIDGSGRTASDP